MHCDGGSRLSCTLTTARRGPTDTEVRKVMQYFCCCCDLTRQVNTQTTASFLCLSGRCARANVSSAAGANATKKDHA